MRGSVGFPTARPVVGIQGREVKQGHAIHYEAGQMVGGQTVAQPHGQIQRLRVVHLFECSTHAQQYTITDGGYRLLSDKLLAFKKIPREVLEKKAVEQGDISFYELAALDACIQQTKRSVEVELQNFFLPPDDVPEDVRHAITHWSQWIDYWAVDWDYRDDTFHNQWQTYRTRKSPKILLKSSHEYDEPGCATVVIKVIDVLGNDTTKAVRIEVK